MAPKSSSSHGKRSSLSRASSSRRKHSRAVTIEDVLDPEDRLHRISEASSPAMGSGTEDVTTEWYNCTGGESRVSMEASRSELAPVAPAAEEKDTTEKPVSDEPHKEEESKLTSNPPDEDQHLPTAVTSGTSTAAETRDPSPAPQAVESKVDEEIPITETNRPPTLEHIQPNPVRFQSPPGQWAYPAVHGPHFPPHFRPFPHPLPPSVSPPLFGMPGMPPLPQDLQISRPLEPLAMSGYELLASRLSNGQDSELPIPPVYRRFRGFSHRILLSLQDELTNLEEKLRMLDESDSHNRRYRDGILPASLRHDNMEPTDVTAARKQILESAAYKMYQYSSQLDIFKKISSFRDAMPEDVHDYRVFLATEKPVVPSEARFLDRSSDLLCLPDVSYYFDEESVSGNQTPSTRAPRLLEAPTAPSTDLGVLDQAREYTTAVRSGHTRRTRPLDPVRLRHMAVGICLAIVLPILSFPVIVGFLSRMTVVALVGLGMAVVGVVSGLHEALSGRAGLIESGIALGIYVGFMAVVAATFG